MNPVSYIKKKYIKYKYDIMREMIWERNHIYGKEPKFANIEDIVPDSKIKEYMSLEACVPNNKLFKEITNLKRK